MNRIASATRWMLLAGIAAGGLLVCALAGWWLHNRGYNLHESIEWVLGQVRGLGPVAFFGLLALLPSVGVPVSVFTLTAGPVFAPTLGLPLVVALALLSLAVNLVITYVLARWILRPWIERLCAWLGFKIPEVAEADQRSLVLLVRVTPGPPYVLQNYLLGVARIPFATYLMFSWAVVCAYTTAFIVFGDAIAQGKGRWALLAASLFVALTVGVKFLRKRLQRKQTEVAP
ncbi:MAG: VTT domain-containing protein [Opitutaceae bacterium]|jgi:uncharacterized membrane protein YdjX (TVP38/TMEM64 family)